MIASNLEHFRHKSRTGRDSNDRAKKTLIVFVCLEGIHTEQKQEC